MLAIQSAVFIEYGNNEDHLKKAVECGKMACASNPTNAYWFYCHSLALTAYRRFLQTFKSTPNKNEMNAIQEAITKSNIQNPNIKYHEIILFKDTVLHNFHLKKKNIYNCPSDQHSCNTKKLIQMIQYVTFCYVLLFLKNEFHEHFVLVY